MNIHEYQAKDLLRQYGVAVLNGKMATTPEAAQAAAEALGGQLCVVKAQIHAGGRGKAGGVKLAKTPQEARDIAAGLLGDQYQYWNSDANYYSGDTRWHSDTRWPPPIRFFKFAIYLDPMTRDGGALRVIPGSHRAGEPYAEIVHRELNGDSPWGGIHGRDVPAEALETQPGDVAVFNHATKHSAWGGSDRRRMFTMVFTERHTGEALHHFQEVIRNHGYSKRDVFGDPAGPLLGTAAPGRKRHLEQLWEQVPDDAPAPA